MEDIEQIEFSCDLSFNVPSKPLEFSIKLDDDVLFECNGTEEKYQVNCSITDDMNEHSLKFILAGKTDEHTIVDEGGNVIESAQVEITNIMFDDIDISDMAYNNHELMIYRHNTNGHSDLVECAFDPSLGFNGEVELKFHTPIYLWLLENM